MGAGISASFWTGAACYAVAAVALAAALGRPDVQARDPGIRS